MSGLMPHLPGHECESVQRIACADHQKLPATQHVSHRPVADGCGQMKMPKDIADGRIPGNQISRRIAAEQKLAGGAQDAGTSKSFARKIVAPADLAGLIVDSFRTRLRPQCAALPP